MRQTVQLDSQLLADAEQLAIETGSPLVAFIEDAIRDAIYRQRAIVMQPSRMKLPVHRGSGLLPGIDLDSSAELLELMEERS